MPLWKYNVYAARVMENYSSLKMTKDISFRIFSLPPCERFYFTHPRLGVFHAGSSSPRSYQRSYNGSPRIRTQMGTRPSVTLRSVSDVAQWRSCSRGCSCMFVSRTSSDCPFCIRVRHGCFIARNLTPLLRRVWTPAIIYDVIHRSYLGTPEITYTT